MVTEPPHCRNFRRATSGSSKEWTPTKMADSLRRRCKPLCREPGERFRGSRASPDSIDEQVLRAEDVLGEPSLQRSNSIREAVSVPPSLILKSHFPKRRQS